MKKIFILNLVNSIDDFPCTSLVGKNDGNKINKLYDLNYISNNYDQIEVRIPKTCCTVNRSFLFGAFGEQIFNLGLDCFLKKYKFKTNSKIIKNRINNHIMNFYFSSDYYEFVKNKEVVEKHGFLYNLAKALRFKRILNVLS